MAILGNTARAAILLAALGFVLVLWILLSVLLGSRQRVPSSPRAASVNGYKLAHGVVALLPSGWLATFGLLILRARIRLGYWPYPMHPDPLDPLGWTPSPLDPKEMPVHHLAVPCMALAAALSLLIYPALSVLDRRVNGERALRTLPLYVFSLLAMLIVWLFDPGQFLSWYVD